jgi:hypothetical protein
MKLIMLRVLARGAPIGKRAQGRGRQYRPAPVTGRPRSPNRLVEPHGELVPEIDPNWPEERLFQHYRDRLAALRDGKASTIADFRRANHAIEAGLRASLPHGRRCIRP